MAKNPAGVTRGSWLNRSGCWGAVTAVGKHNSRDFASLLVFPLTEKVLISLPWGSKLRTWWKPTPQNSRNAGALGPQTCGTHGTATPPEGKPCPLLLALRDHLEKKNSGFIPLWCAEKRLDGVCLENNDFPPLPWAILGVSFSSPVYLSWKTTNIPEDVAPTDEGTTFLH